MFRLLVHAIFVLAVACGDEVKPVKVDIYYETLCGDSIRFIKEQLWPTFQALRRTGIADFNMFPYGKGSQKQVSVIESHIFFSLFSIYTNNFQVKGYAKKKSG